MAFGAFLTAKHRPDDTSSKHSSRESLVKLSMSSYVIGWRPFTTAVSNAELSDRNSDEFCVTSQPDKLAVLVISLVPRSVMRVNLLSGKNDKSSRLPAVDSTVVIQPWV